MPRLGRIVDRIDQALGRLYVRIVGVVTGAMTVWLGRIAVDAVGVREWAGVGLTAATALMFGAVTVYCFRRDRRLSDTDV